MDRLALATRKSIGVQKRAANDIKGGEGRPKKIFTWNPPIAYRLAICFSTVILLGMGILGYVLVSYQQNLMTLQTNEFGSAISAQYAHGATELVFSEDVFGLNILTNNLVSDPRILGAGVITEVAKSEGSDQLSRFDYENIKIIAEAGEVPAAFKMGYALNELIYNDNNEVVWHRNTSSGQEKLVSFIEPVMFKGVTAAYAIVTLSHTSISHGFVQTMKTMSIATLVMIVLSIGLAIFIAKRISKPINKIIDITGMIAEGKYSTTIKEKRTDEFGKLIQAVNDMTESLQEKHQMEGLLSRVVADDVAKKMLSDLNKPIIGSEQVDATVLFVDIVGFTSLTENSGPEATVSLLEEYFGYFNQCARLYHGSVNKFLGDCAMIIFGVPRPLEDHRYNAIACAVAIQQLMFERNRRRTLEGLSEVNVRIGINSGNMMAGNIGVHNRMEYTVIGDPVNIASRLCDIAEPNGILIGKDTYENIKTAGKIVVEAVEPLNLKGKSNKTEAFRLITVNDRRKVANTMIRDILSD